MRMGWGDEQGTRNERGKTNGTDWFPARCGAARRRGSCEVGRFHRHRVCHRRQETLAPVNNPIKMDRKLGWPWIWTMPPGAAALGTSTALLLSSLLLPLQVLPYREGICTLHHSSAEFILNDPFYRFRFRFRIMKFPNNRFELVVYFPLPLFLPIFFKTIIFFFQLSSSLLLQVLPYRE